ncbi:SMI1/KNR4 family protein [Pradoshia eiseniae]|uniref:SMI1/KNR4 family protein n=1 Tax=Pradoshia eiseniae TaxID=2064768 RepID=A0A2S7MX25_9BACI|nr:SMI1/KNR4 family protein [Pradoshia eiseniae]PQD94315.1 SMI1/KNR4 family protein [Pradoshia eiseniae]
MAHNIWEKDDEYKPKPVSDELVHTAEAKLQVTLPPSYKELLKQQNGGRFIHNAHPAPQHEDFDEPFIEVEYIEGIGKNDGILESEELIEEWELPKGLVLFSGDGHTWLAFDYRETNANPPIVYVDNYDEFPQVIKIADNFDEFLENLYTAEIELLDEDDEEYSPVTYSKEEFENMMKQDDVDSLYNILEYDNYEVDADEDWYIGKLLQLSTHHDDDIRTSVAYNIWNWYTSELDSERLNQFINIFQADTDSDIRSYAEMILEKISYSLEDLKREMYDQNSDYGYDVISRIRYKGNSHFIIQREGKWILESRGEEDQHFNSIEEFFEKATLGGIPLAEAWGDVRKL